LAAALIGEPYAPRGNTKAAASGYPLLAASKTRQLALLPSAAGGTGPANWCDDVAAGTSGRGQLPVELAAAHALVREFAVTSAYQPADLALAASLANPSALESAGIGDTLADYAELLDDVCALPADGGSLADPGLDVVRGVAIVRPGRGGIELPPGIAAVVLDLRGLADESGLPSALVDAAAPALARRVDGPGRIVRTHAGPTDEVPGAGNVYSTSLDLALDDALPARGSRDLPIVLLTDSPMAPSTAAFAATLRTARRAWLVGEDVDAAVAEASWRPVGPFGIVARTSLALRTFRRQPPTTLRGQLVRQDDPFDPATASYRRDIHLAAGDVQMTAVVAGAAQADLDAYLLYDVNRDGTFTFPNELWAASTSAGPNETIRAALLPSGDYQLWVHGYQAPPGARGFRLRLDMLAGEVWPDDIAADFATVPSTRRGLAELALSLAGRTPRPVTGPALRSQPAFVDPAAFPPSTSTGLGELRADLLIVHGMARLFYPYFGVVGDRIDERLLETLSTAETSNAGERSVTKRLLSRFGEVLRDGHQAVWDLTGPIPEEPVLPLSFDRLGDRPLVIGSRDPGIEAGDVVVAIDGRPVGDVLDEYLAIASAATDDMRFLRACDLLSLRAETALITVVDPAGLERQVEVEPGTSATWLAARNAPRSRASGPLAGFDAPDLYYLNLDFSVTPDAAAFDAALGDAAARHAQGLVVDMRGYPGFNNYYAAARLARGPFLSPIFNRVTYRGPDRVGLLREQYALGPYQPWTGPIVVITGPGAISAAENFLQMIVGSRRADALVGRRSAGTNGNITRVSLPGAFLFSYTGMEVRNPDDSQFEGVGIVPDNVVPVSAEEVRDGVDRDLLTAIEVLRGDD
jgi:C-terminal processing protease CtpA/Prc